METMKNWKRIFGRSHFQQIKTLNLHMRSWYILEAFPRGFARLKWMFPNVENLKVVFTQMHGRRDIPIQDFTLRLIKRLSHKLKTLRIEFTHCAFVKDEHLGVLSKTLRSGLSSLESLELEFEGLSHKIKPKAIGSLWKSLEKIPKLKRLELVGGFAPNKINYEAFSTLCDVLHKRSATLLALKIDVGYVKLTSKAHQQICRVLYNMLPRLKSLELKFLGFESVNNQSLISFGDLLSMGSDSLNNLNLQFGISRGLTTKGAKDFAERLKNRGFPMMEKLMICFNRAENKTHDGLYDISEAISVAFPNLKFLRFFYTSSGALTNSEITEKANIMLKERLKNLPQDWKLW